jgi:large subunit ribosomal protein L4
VSTVDIHGVGGDTVGTTELPDDVFDVQANIPLMHQVVVAQLAAARQGTHKAKTRAEVSGGGKKPYKQKGTGNARQGSTRAPNYVGGGKVFGPHPRSYEYTVPKKVKRAALASALSLRAKEKKLVVVDQFSLKAPKTKEMAGILKALGVERALVVDAVGNANLFKSVRNLPRAKALAPAGLNVFDILNHPGLVIAAGAIKQVEERVLPAAAPAEKAAQA